MAPYIAAVLLTLIARPVLAALGYQTSSDLGLLGTFLIAVVALSGILYILFKIFSSLPQRESRSQGSASDRKGNFHNQATAHGFRQTETRLLTQIAGNVPTNMSSDLLESAIGRDYLISDLKKRVSRRQREIELIRRIQTKLEKMGANELTPRATARVNADMRIWVAKKLQHATADEEEEDVFTEIDPVSGRLQDISEGGAALLTDLEVDRGDMIEFWSADPDITLSPITAIIVDIKSTETSRDGLLHIHFMDPPLGDLHSAIYALQSRNETRAT